VNKYGIEITQATNVIQNKEKILKSWKFNSNYYIKTEKRRKTETLMLTMLFTNGFVLLILKMFQSMDQ